MCSRIVDYRLSMHHFLLLHPLFYLCKPVCTCMYVCILTEWLSITSIKQRSRSPTHSCQYRVPVHGSGTLGEPYRGTAAILRMRGKEVILHPDPFPRKRDEFTRWVL